MRKLLPRARRPWRLVLALVLVSIPVATGPALAAPLTWEFEAVVTSVESGPLTEGTVISGSYTFDRALPDDPLFQDDIRNIIIETQLTFPAGTFAATKQGPSFTFIRIIDDGPDGDVYEMNWEEGSLQYFFVLEDSTGGVFDSTDIPTVPPDLALFDSMFFRVHGTHLFGDLYDFQADLTSLTLPEPTAAWLCLAGLGALIALRRSSGSST